MRLRRHVRPLAVLLLATTAAVPATEIAGAATLPGGSTAASAATAATTPGATTRVVVRGVPGTQPAVERAVTAVGGRVTRRLPILDGVAATVPATAVARLRGFRTVAAVTPDTSGRVLALDPALGYDTGDRHRRPRARPRDRRRRQAVGPGLDRQGRRRRGDRHRRVAGERA